DREVVLERKGNGRLQVEPVRNRPRRRLLRGKRSRREQHDGEHGGPQPALPPPGGQLRKDAAGPQRRKEMTNEFHENGITWPGRARGPSFRRRPPRARDPCCGPWPAGRRWKAGRRG